MLISWIELSWMKLNASGRIVGELLRERWMELNSIGSNCWINGVVIISAAGWAEQGDVTDVTATTRRHYLINRRQSLWWVIFPSLSSPVSKWHHTDMKMTLDRRWHQPDTKMTIKWHQNDTILTSNWPFTAIIFKSTKNNTLTPKWH